jgi:hypothetical protein
VAHAGATAPGLAIRCTNPHAVAVIGTTASSKQHPAPATTRGGFGVKRKAHGAWGPGGPPRPPAPTSNQPVLQPAARAWQCPSGRILGVLRELALAREREGRKRPLHSLLPRLLWWGAHAPKF